MASGLAGKVRKITESDEFDLAGYDQVDLLKKLNKLEKWRTCRASKLLMDSMC